MRSIWQRLKGSIDALVNRRKLEREMAEEMDRHIEELTRENIANGMMPVQAREAALKRFGGVAQIEERCRDERGFVWLDQLSADFRFTVRSLLHARGFTSIVILTLFLGVGVTTVVFDLTAWILVYKSPFPEAQQLYAIGVSPKTGKDHHFFNSNVAFRAYQEQVDLFSAYAFSSPAQATVVVDGEPVAATVHELSRDSLAVLGISPVLGRSFLPQEHAEGGDRSVIISDLFWRQHFGASPDVLGRSIRINNAVGTVVGVLANGQRLPSTFDADIFEPFIPRVDPPETPLDTGGYIIGRLRPGVTPDQALAALSAVKLPRMTQWAEDYVALSKPYIAPVDQIERPGTDWVMLVAALFLYAIACLNAMNLMLIRLSGRRRELSIRFAVGGSRWQVVRLVILECLLLACAASLLVVAAAKWLFPVLFVFLSKDNADQFRNYWDWGTLACVGGLTLFATLVVAMAPLTRLIRANITTGLKDGGPTLGDSKGTARTRVLLIVAQSAFAVILLVGAGLMVRSFEKLAHLDLGFDPTGRVKIEVSIPSDYVVKPEDRGPFFDRIKERLEKLPGVRAVSYGQDSLFTGFFGAGAELVMPDGTFVPVAGSYVTADFAKTAGLQLMQGRWITAKKWDGEAVINENFAHTLFGKKDPVGQSFRIKISPYPILIVGVVRDVRETARSPAGPRFYVPYWMWTPNINTLTLRLDKDPTKEFISTIRPVIYEVAPRLIVQNVRSINQVVLDSMPDELFALTVLKGLSVIALGLAVVGVFSVISYAAAKRMPEFGLRMALGASGGNIRRLVIMRGLGATGVGLAIGAIGAAVLTRFMESLLFETKPYDLTVYLSVALMLMLSATAACFWPAHRASKVDVAKLLRAD